MNGHPPKTVKPTEARVRSAKQRVLREARRRAEEQNTSYALFGPKNDQWEITVWAALSILAAALFGASWVDAGINAGTAAILWAAVIWWRWSQKREIQRAVERIEQQPAQSAPAATNGR